MRSGANVRDGENGLHTDTNLIIDDRITDVFGQTTKLIRILDIGEETCDLPLVRQWFQLTENIFKCPSNPCLSDPVPDLGTVGLLFEGFPPLTLLDLALRSRHTERFRKPFNPGYQRFDCFPIGRRLLGQSLVSWMGLGRWTIHRNV